MEKKTNLLEMLLWAALVSFVVITPAHSQSANTSLFGDNTWSDSFDMDPAVTAANQSMVAQSAGATGDQSHETIKTVKAIEPALSPKPNLEHADNANITRGAWFGNTSFPSGSYSYGFNGTGASTSTFNTGLPTCSTGSVDLSITDGY